jgi:cytochrome b
VTDPVVKLWDPVVRLLHWALAGAFLANYLFTEEGESWHQWIGYCAAGVVLTRLAWGFLDTGAARWSAFWPTRHRLAEHARALVKGHHHAELGHSPIGAVVMIAMLCGIFALGTTGFMMEEIDYFWGEDWLEQLHGWIADGVVTLVVLHVSAAVVESVRMRENLPWSMITGRRRSSPGKTRAQPR